MKIENIATINYFDQNENEEACAIIRKVEGYIALSLSLKSNGDLETLLKKEDTLKIIEALRKAMD